MSSWGIAMLVDRGCVLLIFRPRDVVQKPVEVRRTRLRYFTGCHFLSANGFVLMCFCLKPNRDIDNKIFIVYYA